MRHVWLLCLAVVAREPAAPATELNDSTFEPFVETNARAFVLLYRSGHESTAWLTGIFDRFRAAQPHTDLQWGRLDLAHNGETAKMFEGVDLPAVVAYREGEWVSQSAAAGVVDVDAFVQRMTGEAAPVPVLRTEEELHRAEANYTFGLFYTVSHEYEVPRAMALVSLLSDQYGLPGFVVRDTWEGLPRPRATLRRDFDDGDKSFGWDGQMSALQLKQLVAAFHHRRCRPMDDLVVHQMVQFNMPTVIIFAEREDDPVVREVERGILAAAPALRCGVVVPSNPEWEQMAGPFALSPGRLPFVAIATGGNTPDLYGYPPSRERSVQDFLASYAQGSEPVFHRSEEVPTWQDPLVRKVVRKSFEEEVRDSARDVFLAFMDQWCAECPTLFHRLKAIAAQLAPRFPQVQFAVVDYQLNAIDGIGLRKLPGFFLYRAGRAEGPVEFTAPLTAEAVEAFLGANLPPREQEDPREAFEL